MHLSTFLLEGYKENHQEVTECEVCQHHKGETVATLGLLQPLPILDDAWTNIFMDFINELLSSQGKTTIFVVVDYLTKYVHFCVIRHPYTVAGVAHTFVKNIVKLHEILHSIVSDRDKIFTSTFWKELFCL